jgi:hypothetical protein
MDLTDHQEGGCLAQFALFSYSRYNYLKSYKAIFMKKIFVLCGLIISILFLLNLNIRLIFAAECASGETPATNNCTLSSSPVPPLPNPLGAGTTPQTLIGKVIAAALGVVGSLALLMFIFGGLTWMTSAGSAERVTKGKGIMIWAALGLIIIFTSYALVRFVIEGITKTTP